MFKIKKYLIYLFLFLLFNFFFDISLKANPTFVDGTAVDDQGGDDNTAAERFTSGLSFNNDGTKMYIVGTESKDVHEFELNPGFDISTRTYDAGDSYDLDDKSATPTSVKFNNDGTKMFMVSHSRDIHEYSLPAFDVSEASFEQTKTLTELSTEPKDVEFNADGTKMFILDTSSIYVYTLSTAFDISTASYDNYAFSTADYETGLKAFDFSDDGKVMIILGNVDDTFHEYYLSTGFDLTTASHVSSFALAGAFFDQQPKGMAFNNTGSKMFFLGGTDTDKVFEFTLVSNYNLKLPTLSSSSPADNATGVSVDANIVLNFSEKVNVDNGNITIHKTSDDTTVATIDVTSSNVTGTGTSQITINPTDDLEYGVEYYVLIPATAFVDNTSGYYAGISSTTALSFTVSNDRLDPTTIKDVVGSIDAQSELAKNYISQSIDTVSNRLRFLRQNRMSNSLSSQDLQIDLGNTILASLANDNIEKNANSMMPDNWSAWTAGSTYVLKIGDSINSSSKETEGQAVALGFDKKLSDSDFLGFAIQYGESDTDIGTNGTSIDSENMNFSIYRTKPLDNNNFIETLLGVGLIESDLKRVHNSNVLTGTRDGTQIFGSINYGKTIDKGDFNITPIGRLDLGYTKLDDYKETGINALYYASQRIESGLASFGFEVSDNIQFNENKLQPFGSLKFITDFSNSSDAKINYVTDTLTIYTYTQEANSDHLISSMIGLTYIAGDYLNINSSYSRIQGNRSERRDTIDFAINFISNRETHYSLSLAGDENAEAKLGISKNIYGFDLGFNASESFSVNPNQEAELMLTYNF
ncbi:autotransporter domain-containing protein [Pelagibacteraceae bacterium]|nr:autotransporter domain-containing protein [Pelagibacteraceae bacterium]